MQPGHWTERAMELLPAWWTSQRIPDLYHFYIYPLGTTSDSIQNNPPAVHQSFPYGNSTSIWKEFILLALMQRTYQARLCLKEHVLQFHRWGFITHLGHTALNYIGLLMKTWLLKLSQVILPEVQCCLLSKVKDGFSVSKIEVVGSHWPSHSWAFGG